MSVLHEGGYVHRDIKPNNFMLKLKPEPKVLLVDFSTTLKNLNDGEQDYHIFSISGTRCYADELVMKKSTNV
ncbi:hypothetical protein, partial [Klebsiella aerogenes]|uniref:hypothetical protein n=1 Tax=Klebsiella aerogenes TaxID=548 RepID=UPI001CC7AD80